MLPSVDFNPRSVVALLIIVALSLASFESMRVDVLKLCLDILTEVAPKRSPIC